MEGCALVQIGECAAVQQGMRPSSETGMRPSLETGMRYRRDEEEEIKKKQIKKIIRISMPKTKYTIVMSATGSYALNRGQAAHLSTSRWRATDRRPRCLGGCHRAGGTL